MRRNKVTIRHVAQAARVSVSTVSVALSGRSGVSAAKRAHIQQVAKYLGYQPNRAAAAIRLERTFSLGVVTNLEQGFQTAIVDEIYRQGPQLGYRIILSGHTHNHSEWECAQDLILEHCEGLMLIGSNMATEQIQQLGEQVPLALICAQHRAANVDCVVSTDELGIYQAMEMLISRGLQRVSFIKVDDDIRSEVREQAYRKAMSQAGLSRYVQVLTGSNSLEGGAGVGQQLLNSKQALPQAVLAFNDTCAMGFAIRLLRAGYRIPQDLAVVGFDDSPISRFPHLALTTVRQDPHLLVQAAFGRLLDHIEQVKDLSVSREAVLTWTGKVLEVPTTLVCRETT